jgi:hypothetical protein
MAGKGILSGLGKLIGGAGAANPAMLGLGAIGSIGQGIAGLIQSGKAKKAMKRLQDPGYNIPPEVAKNLAIYENMAQTGMDTAEYNKAQQDISRSVSTGTRALGRSSNPSAGAASLVRAGADALTRLGVQSDSIKRQNILGAMGARKDLAEQKLAKQRYEQQSYADQYNQLNALRGAGIQNTIGGISGLGQLGLYSNIYGKGNNPTQQGQSFNPMSPAQMSMLSTYQTPLLNNVGLPKNLSLPGSTGGSMNFGSFRTPSPYSLPH